MGASLTTLAKMLLLVGPRAFHRATEGVLINGNNKSRKIAPPISRSCSEVASLLLNCAITVNHTQHCLVSTSCTQRVPSRSNTAVLFGGTDACWRVPFRCLTLLPGAVPPLIFPVLPSMLSILAFPGQTRCLQTLVLTW